MGSEMFCLLQLQDPPEEGSDSWLEYVVGERCMMNGDVRQMDIIVGLQLIDGHTQNGVLTAP